MCQGQCACSGPLIVLYTSDKGSYSARRAPTHTILPNTVTPVWIGIRVVIRVRSTSVECQWYSTLGARSMLLDARSFMISTLRSQVGFAAAVAHARLRLSRLEPIGGSGRTAGRYASAARAFISPTGPASSRRGEAHLFWEREAAGSGSLGGSFFLVDRGRRGAGARGSVRVRWAAGLRWGPRSARPTTGLVARMCVCAFVGRDGCQGCL